MNEYVVDCIHTGKRQLAEFGIPTHSNMIGRKKKKSESKKRSVHTELSRSAQIILIINLMSDF
jgi:hypothetical protein